jgi:hypothetical protein
MDAHWPAFLAELTRARIRTLMGHDRAWPPFDFSPFSSSTGDAYGHFTELFLFTITQVTLPTCFFFLGGLCLICTEKKLNFILGLLSRPVISFSFLFFFSPPSAFPRLWTVALAYQDVIFLSGALYVGAGISRYARVSSKMECKKLFPYQIRPQAACATGN